MCFPFKYLEFLHSFVCERERFIEYEYSGYGLAHVLQLIHVLFISM